MLFKICALLILVWQQVPCDTLLVQGDRVRAKGELEKAMAIYDQAVKMYPERADAKWRLARSYLETADDVYNKGKRPISTAKKMQQYRTGLRLSFQAIKQNPKDARAWEMVSTSYAAIIGISNIKQQARLADSVRVYAEEAARLNPKEDTPWHILGRWHYEVTRLNWMLKMFAHFFLGGAPEGSYQKAEYYLRQAVLAVDAPVNRFWLAQCLEAQGKTLQAKAEYERIMAMEGKMVYHNDPVFIEIARKRLNK
jgi:tetratricopeptide (TPR) repeat protein